MKIWKIARFNVAVYKKITFKDDYNWNYPIKFTLKTDSIKRLLELI